MRKLTVKRRKAFAGCFAKVKLYIQDANGDTEINCIRCRFLGKLKNKESATYEIGNESRKLFAIYDNMGKKYCNDTYVIPEGDDDIEVSGVVKLNQSMGNPFLFDENTIKTIYNKQAHREMIARTVFPIIFVAVVVIIGGLLIGLLKGLYV